MSPTSWNTTAFMLTPSVRGRRRATAPSLRSGDARNGLRLAQASACCSSCAMRWRSAAGSCPPSPIAVVAASGGDGGRSPAELGGRIAVGAATSGGDKTPLDCARLSVAVAPPEGGVPGGERVGASAERSYWRAKRSLSPPQLCAAAVPDQRGEARSPQVTALVPHSFLTGAPRASSACADALGRVLIDASRLRHCPGSTPLRTAGGLSGSSQSDPIRTSAK